MKNFLYAIFLSPFFSLHVSADPHIFWCIESDDLECLKVEMNLGEKWKTSTNKAGETIVSAAIRKKNIVAINSLVKHGALVTSKDVIYAMNIFFDTPKEYFEDSAQKTLDAWEESSETTSLAEQLLYALKNQVNADKFVAVTKVIDLFCSRELLSTILAITNLPNETFIKIIEKYSNLFLQDEPLSKYELKKIVQHLLITPAYAQLVLLITDAYLAQPTPPILLPAPPLNLPHDYRQMEHVTTAIMEQSRELYEQLPPKELVQHVIADTPHPTLALIADRNDRLGSFVQKSISSRRNYRMRLKNYEFWHQVYENLVYKGDFSGAFAIGMALEHSSIDKIILLKDRRLVPLVNPVDNFKNYREATKQHKNGTYLPAIMVMLRDLNSANVIGFFGKDKKTITQNALNFFIRWRAEYAPTYNFARSRKIGCTKNLKNALNDLPALDAKPSLFLWKERYKTLLLGEESSI